MSTQQFLSLALDAGASQKFEALHLLALAARYALPDAYPNPDTTKLSLAVRFSNVSTISLPNATAWLTAAGVQLTPLDSAVTSAMNGDSEALHVALQRGNDAHQIQLLIINDASKLIELVDAGEEQLTPTAMSSKAIPCLLLRYGYNPENDYAYYSASLQGDSYRPIKITWGSVLSAGVSAGVVISPPLPKVDLEMFNQAADIMEQALHTAAQAHTTMRTALGQYAPAAIAAPEQAV